jgi:CMP-N,N'-diacetyllegionaminic acid synthase
MIGGERVVAVIPARGGSKTVPGKNIRVLAGRPLLAWSIGIGLGTPEIDRVVVSTDDAAIANVARQHGGEVYPRPAELATDTALVIDALRDLIRRFRAEGETATIMVLLEPTCPLRSVGDVSRCLHVMHRRGLDSVATFREAELNPHRAWSIVDERPIPFVLGAVPWLPRQKLPEAYQLNGAVYAFRMDKLDATAPSLLVGTAGAVLMPRTRSVDIDDELDFEFAEGLIRRRLHEQDDL